MAIMGFGGGAMIATPIKEYLLGLFYKAPTYLGPESAIQLVTEGGKRLAEANGQMVEVVVASAKQLASAPVPLQEGVYVVGTFESDAVDFGDGPVSNAAAPIQNPGHMVEGDYFILKLDAQDGSFMEVRTPVSGGTGVSLYGEDFARAVAATPNGDAIFVGGFYSDPIDYGGGQETSQGGRDIFVLKMLP